MISTEMLRRYQHFAGISEKSLKELAMIASERTVSAGTQIFCEGETVKCLNVIIKGEVDIRYMFGTGEVRTVDTLVDGDLLCWSALIAPYRTTAIGTAVKDTHLICIEAEKIRDLCNRDPILGYKLTTQVCKLLANRLDRARIQLAVAE